ncbi:MAG: protein kinase [Acidisphaera sp.]|nr:protein kinase [Acidisphaera sp.]
MSERALEEKLGKYEIRSVLGRGAMGTVYEGFDPIIERKVAVKTVRLPDAADSEAQDELARFRREAQAAGRLHHPNIVGVFDYGETGELAYIVMEFVDGHTLKSVLDKQERFSPAETVRVMEGLLAGLQYSHERGVVHRDIKPANVILTAAGDVKIADFGIARIESSSMTQAGTVLGTPAYMSPEQFMGQTVDLRTDIYSSGVVLYQLLTGERPFEGSMTAIMHKALNTAPPRPSELSVTAPPAFDAVVGKAMAKRPEERYASAVAFAAAIRGALEAPAVPPVSADGPAPDAADATLVLPASALPTPGPPAVAAPRPARRFPMMAAASAVVLALIAGGAWLALRAGEAPPHAAATAPPAAGPPAQTAAVAPAPAPAPSPAATPVAPPPRSPTNAAAAPTPAVTAPVAATPAPAPPVPPTAASPPPAPPVTPPAASPPASPAAPAPQTVQAAPPSPAPSPNPVPPAAPAAAPSPSAGGTQPAPPPPAVAAQPPSTQSLAMNAAPVSRDAVASAVGGVDCSLVAADVTNNAIALSGLVQRGGSESALRRALADAAPAASIDWRVTGFDGPYCQALDVLRPIAGRAAAPPSLQLSVDGSAAPLQQGDLIIARLAMPDFAGYLRADYLSHDGTVFHMSPAKADAAHLYAAGSHVTLGQPTANFTGWQVDQPYGSDMIIAVASSQALFSRARPEVEQADAYLRELQAAIDALRRRGGRLAGNAVALVTEPHR